jgi:protein-ribulosamine 3-kinase
MSGLPGALIPPLQAALASLGDSTPIIATTGVGGGCINNGLRLETQKEVYFLKWNDAPLAGMFPAEAYGLEQIARTHSVRVPGVLGLAEKGASAGSPAFLLLEWLEGPAQQDQAVLGIQLAEMHRRGLSPQNPPAYGLDRDNTIGSTPQRNAWDTDWVTFFRESRLRPQIELARRNRRLPAERQRRLERLIERLPDWLGGVQRQPALLHGDLWGGNVISSPDGPALIDPAIYYGDREAELAFTELFGGFSTRFYQAYHATWALDPGYAERRDLYNLYHLLNHLNLFGESYGPEVDGILRAFVR